MPLASTQLSSHTHTLYSNILLCKSIGMAASTHSSSVSDSDLKSSNAVDTTNSYYSNLVAIPHGQETCSDDIMFPYSIPIHFVYAGQFLRKEVRYHLLSKGQTDCPSLRSRNKLKNAEYSMKQGADRFNRAAAIYDALVDTNPQGLSIFADSPTKKHMH
jgi:hypothetical protein